MLKKFLVLLLFTYSHGLILVNNSDSYYAFWLDELSTTGSNFTICTNDKQYFPVRLYVNSNDKLLENFNVYDSNGTSTNLIGTLNSNTISTTSSIYPRNIISSSGCFTIARNTNNNVKTSATLFFLRDSVTNPRCNLKNGTVFQASSNYNSTFTFPNACEYFILSPPSPLPVIPIESITASVLYQQNRIVFKSAVNKNVYLDTSIASAPIIWQNLRFYTPALSFAIYQNTVVKLSNKTALISKSDSSIQRGLIASPSYGGFQQIIDANLLSFTMNFDSNMTIIFDVKQMDQGQQLILQNNDLKQNFSIVTNLTQNPQFYGKSFTVFYSQSQTSGTSFLVYYTIAPANFKTKTVATISREKSMHVELIGNLLPGEGATICGPADYDFGLNTDLFVANVNEYSFKIYASDDGSNFDMYLQYVNNSRKDSYTGVLTKISLPSFYKRCITVYRESYYYNVTSEQALAVFKFYDGYVNCDVRAPTTIRTVNLTNYYDAPCKFTILSPMFSSIMLSNMSMVTNRTVTISSALNQKSLIDLKNDEINLWQNLNLFTPVLGIVVPVGGFFSFTITYSPGNTINQVIANQKGVIASPAYNGFFSSSSSSSMPNNTAGILTTLSTSSYGLSIKFTSSEVSSFNNFCIENVGGNKNYSISSNNDLSLNGNQFNIWYLNNQDNAFKINYQFGASSSPALKSMTSTTLYLLISFILIKISDIVLI